jgi:hypothetical protein
VYSVPAGGGGATPVFNYTTFTGSTPVTSIVNGGTGSGIANGVAYLGQGNIGHQGGGLWNNAPVNIQSFTMTATFVLPTWESCVITAGSANITIPSTNNGLTSGQVGLANMRFVGNFGSVTGITTNDIYVLASTSTAGGTTTFTVGVTPGGTGSCTVTAILMCGFSFSVQNSNATSNQSPFLGTQYSGDANISGIGGYALSSGVQYPLGNSFNVNLIMGNGGSQLNSTPYGPGQSSNSIGFFVNGGPFQNLSTRNDLNPFGLDLYTGDLMSLNVVYDGTYMDVTVANTVTNAQARVLCPLSNLTSIVGANTALVGFNQGMLPQAQDWVASWAYSTGYNTRLAEPSFSVSPGLYASSQSVTLTAAAGATIWYSTNGLLPSPGAPYCTQYTGTISVASTQNIQAVAAQSGFTTSYASGGVFQIAAGTPPKVNFPSGFASIGGQLLLNGFPYVNGSNYIQLAGNGNYFFNGGVWTAAPQPVSTFTTTFEFTSAAAGDAGFTFCLQNSGQSATSYNTPQDGGWIFGGPLAVLDSQVVGAYGYACQQTPYAPNTQIVGFVNGICVVFDMSVGSYGGVGLYTGGVLLSGSTTSLPSTMPINGGHLIQAAFSYNGTTLSLTLTDTNTSDTYPLSWTVNIPAYVGGSTAFAGFTSGTGFDSTANIQLRNWTM